MKKSASLRSLGLSPRQLGISPRQLGVSKRQLKAGGFVDAYGPRGACIYVVVDSQRGWVKIGQTVNIRGRMAAYRTNGDTHRVLVETFARPSKAEALRVEALAITLLAERLERASGDWFVGPSHVAIACVRQAIP